MRYILQTMSVALIAVCSLSCEKVEHTAEIFADSRTVLMYIAADDNELDSEAGVKVDAVLSGWKAEHGRLLLFVDRNDGSPALLEARVRDRRNVADTIKVYTTQNSASAQLFAEVLADMKHFAPGKSYGMIFFSHATGWLPQGAYNNPTAVNRAVGADYAVDRTVGAVNCAVDAIGAVGGVNHAVGAVDYAVNPTVNDAVGAVNRKGRSVGSDGRDEMELRDFAAAIEDGLFEFMIFEACFMSGVEVAYELRNKSRYIVASAAEIVRPGFYALYDRFVPLIYKPNADLRRVAQLYYEHTLNMEGAYRSSTISVIDCSGLETLAATCAQILNSSTANVDLSSIQYFDRNVNKLFFDLGDYIGQHSTPALRLAFDDAMRSCILYKANTERFMDGYGGFDIKSHCGLTTYIAQPHLEGLNARYQTLQWARRVAEK